MACAAHASAPVLPPHLVELRKGMSLAEKVAQITQLDIMEILDVDAAAEGKFELDASKLAPFVEAGVGSFLNSPTAGGAMGKLVSPSAQQWRGALAQLHKAYADAGKVRQASPACLCCTTASPTRPHQRHCHARHERCTSVCETQGVQSSGPE